MADEMTIEEIEADIIAMEAKIDRDCAAGSVSEAGEHGIRTILAAARDGLRLRRMEAGWQPIGSAPAKTTVLVWNGEQVRVAQPLPYGETWAYQDGYGWCRPAPTHFMPLPPPPQEKER